MGGEGHPPPPCTPWEFSPCLCSPAPALSPQLITARHQALAPHSATTLPSRPSRPWKCPSPGPSASSPSTSPSLKPGGRKAKATLAVSLCDGSCLLLPAFRLLETAGQPCPGLLPPAPTVTWGPGGPSAASAWSLGVGPWRLPSPSERPARLPAPGQCSCPPSRVEPATCTYQCWPLPRWPQKLQTCLGTFTSSPSMWMKRNILVTEICASM